MSLPDPFVEPQLDEQVVRRRDLREPSTRRSRRDARRRAEAVRRAAPARRAPAGPRSRANQRTNQKPVKKSLRRRVATSLFSGIALLFAAGLIIATSIPSSLFEQPGSSSASSVKASAQAPTTTTAPGQTLTADGKDLSIDRGTFAATSTEAYGVIKQLAETAGYTVDNSGPIRWPFNTPVPLGDLFGPRAAPCAGCSTFHNGTDFETGDKAPVYAVADGTVTESGVNGDLGYSVSISHDVNGRQFTSVYGHMTAGSLKVKVGDTITKGTEVGLTGSTGESTGPHLFFEIDINDKPIDSFKWLKKYTKH